MTEEHMELAKSYLEQHYFSNGCLSHGYYEELIEMCPEFMYQGEAYRALFLDDHKDLKTITKFSSWSKNLDGIKSFISNRLSDSDSDKIKNKKLLILTSNIQGFDILACIEYLIKEGYYPKNAKSKWLENEVILSEMSEIEEYIKLNSVEDFIKQY